MTRDYKSIFQSALEIDHDDERARFLNDACDGDAALRAQVESLLQAHAAANHFMQPRRQTQGSGLGVEIGQVIGGYKLREVIGEGGMGVVYIAEQTEPVRRKVALKIIKPGMDTREVVARFQAERQALALMDHPNIAKVFDGGATDNGRPYFVMELVRGIPITDYCDRVCLSTCQRLRLFVDASRAIQHAHQRGIIHRDIKPSNVLVSLHDGNAVVKIIDFGVAKAVNQQLGELSVYTRFQQIIGTPLYMSPEQAELSGLDIDMRTDVYSLGVLLYELLTGVTPFDRKTFSRATYDEMRRIIREEEPKKASTRLSGLTHELQSHVARQRGSSPLRLAGQLKGELDWILTKTLSKDRSRRYESCGALASDIERFLKNEPVTAGPPTAAYQIRKFFQRHRIATLTTLAIVSSLVLGTLAATIGLLRATYANRNLEKQIVATQNALASSKASQQQALVAKNRAEAERARAIKIAYLADMRAAFQALELNNLALAKDILERNSDFAPENDPRHWEYRALWRQCQGNAEKVFGDARRGVPLLSVSPDSRWVAAGGAGVRIWDVSKEEIAQTLIEDGEGCMAVFADDVIYTLDETGTIRAWSLPGFAPTEEPVFEGAVRLNASPNARWLVALSRDERVIVWDLATGELAKDLPAKDVDGIAVSNDLLVVRSRDRIARILDSHTFDEVCDPVEAGRGTLAISPDNQRIVTGKDAIMIRAVSDWSTVAQLPPIHTAYVTAVAFSPDGRWMASAGADQTVVLWETETYQPIAKCRQHTGLVFAVAFSGDGSRLFSGGQDGKICVWAVEDLRKVAWPIKKRDIVRWDDCGKSQISFSPDGSTLAATRHEKDTSPGFDLRSAADLEMVRGISKAGATITSVRYSPVENLLVVGDAKGALRFIDFDREEHEDRVVVEEGNEVYPLRFSRDGKRLMVVGKGSDEYRCAVYTIEDRKCIASWVIPKSRSIYVRDLPATLSPQGDAVATGHGDGVRLWSVDAPDEPPVHLPIGNPSKPDRGGTINCVDFSPDGKYLVGGNDRGLIEIVDIVTKRLDGQLVGHTQHIGAVRFSHDGRRLASAGSGRMDALRLWDFETRQEIMTLMVDSNLNRQVEWSPDGNSLLLAGVTFTSLWHVRSFEEIAELEGQPKAKN